MRFVAEQGGLFALKELEEGLARREYRLLRRLNEMGIPAVEPLGIVVDRDVYKGTKLDAVLCTYFLEYSTTYRALYSDPHRSRPTDRLLDALVELLVRLHLAGFFWGDCSLSNTLFRLDAGSLQAIFVDAETSELHPTLSDGQREYDVELAFERVGWRAARPGRRRAPASRRRAARTGRGDPRAVPPAVGHPHRGRHHPP